MADSRQCHESALHTYSKMSLEQRLLIKERRGKWICTSEFEYWLRNAQGQTKCLLNDTDDIRRIVLSRLGFIETDVATTPVSDALLEYT
jgi:hypothetical protein